MIGLKPFNPQKSEVRGQRKEGGRLGRWEGKKKSAFRNPVSLCLAPNAVCPEPCTVLLTPFTFIPLHLIPSKPYTLYLLYLPHSGTLNPHCSPHCAVLLFPTFPSSHLLLIPTSAFRLPNSKHLLTFSISHLLSFPPCTFLL